MDGSTTSFVGLCFRMENFLSDRERKEQQARAMAMQKALTAETAETPQPVPRGLRDSTLLLSRPKGPMMPVRLASITVPQGKPGVEIHPEPLVALMPHKSLPAVQEPLGLEPL